MVLREGESNTNENQRINIILLDLSPSVFNSLLLVQRIDLFFVCVNFDFSFIAKLTFQRIIQQRKIDHMIDKGNG